MKTLTKHYYLNTKQIHILKMTYKDLVKLAWVGPSDLKNYKLTPPSQQLFKRIGYLL